MLYDKPPEKINGDNLFKTKVKNIKCEGELWALNVNIGDTLLSVNSTRNMMADLYPKPGDTLYARIGTDRVRIISGSPEHLEVREGGKQGTGSRIV